MESKADLKKKLSLYMFSSLVPKVDIGKLEINIWNYFVREKYREYFVSNKCFENEQVDKLLHPYILWSIENNSPFLPTSDKELGDFIEAYNENSTAYICNFINIIKKEMELQSGKDFVIEFSYNNNFLYETQRAIDICSQMDPELGWLIKEFVRKIVICESSDLIGCSLQSYPGIIFMAPTSDWDVYMYADTIIHELSHQELYIRQLVDPILFRSEVLFNPIRNQPRPAIAVVHAAFVLFRVVYYLKKLKKYGDTSTSLNLLLEKNYSILKDSLGILAGCSFLTDSGKLLVDKLVENHELKSQENL